MMSQPSPETCAEAAARFAPARLVDAYLDTYTRKTQRLVSSRPAVLDLPGMDALLSHLSWQPGWRAQEEICSAASLALRGYPVLALKALRLAWRSEAKQFMRLRLLRKIVDTSWASARCLKSSGRRQVLPQRSSAAPRNTSNRQSSL
jgi:hypothetical protein